MPFCPCGSGLAFSECCEPLHQGQSAASAEALMRSRFSAFAIRNTAYLSQSWHPSTRPASLELDANEQWLRLDILSRGKDWVEFQAIFRENTQSHDFFVLKEKSRFKYEQGHWFYLDGKHQIKPLKVGRNELCPCGSGKKYKDCTASDVR